VANIEARSQRVNQIPNGSVLGCGACHTSSGGGGSRNAFGQAIESGFLSGSGASASVVWNASIAGMDSDGDGFTNGTELGDPDGDGTATAGAQVTNPGLASSFPQVVNRAPAFATIGAKSVNEGAVLTFAVTATDQDNDTVTITASNLPTGATFANGTFTWTPGFDQSGSFTVSFSASDGKTQTSATATITVANVARPLVINSFSPTNKLFVKGVGDTVRVTVAAQSPDVGSVTYAWQVNGVTQAETTGSFLFTVVDGSTDDVLKVTVGDGTSSLTQSWTIAKALQGDLDGNNEVSFSDFLLFVGAFGKRTADVGFNPLADINGNGTVDFPDFLVFVRFFGQKR
jgi:hypothetical protein